MKILNKKPLSQIQDDTTLKQDLSHVDIYEAILCIDERLSAFEERLNIIENKINGGNI